MTPPPNEEYREGWDRIYGPKERGTPSLAQPLNRMAGKFCCGYTLTLHYENDNPDKKFYKCRDCKREYSV